MTLEAHHLSVVAHGTFGTLLQRVPFLRIKEAVLGARYDLSVALVTSSVARDLNIARRGKDYVPDTLAFPLTNMSGEIIMSPAAIRKTRTSLGMSYEQCVTFLFIHSCLHLKGYAHGSTMERKERQLLERFS